MSVGAILVADDDDRDVVLLRDAFGQIGLDNPVFSVENGTEVIKYLSGEDIYSDREKYPLPFLLILDWKMPGMQSAKVISWIRDQERFCSLLIIVLTGSQSPDEKRLAYQAGANWHLTKSCDLQDMQLLMQRVREFWTPRFSQPQAA